jgi:hypothetical protein
MSCVSTGVGRHVVEVSAAGGLPHPRRTSQGKRNKQMTVVPRAMQGAGGHSKRF